MHLTPRIPALALALFAVAFESTADAVVHPTGQFPLDVLNVRQAALAGGVVRLMAVDAHGEPVDFNFGPPNLAGGFVNLVGDVQLVGESAGGRQATIAGGWLPIRVLVSTGAVRNLHLRSPGAQGVTISRSVSLEVSGNTITDVVPRRSGAFTFAHGIVSGSTAVQGTLLIEDNTISRVHADAAYGISISNFGAAARVTGNTITGVDLNAVLAGANGGVVSIDHNVIVPGPGVTPNAAGNGILFGHTRGGAATIAGNVIVCDNPLADGIAVVGLGTAPLEEHDAVIEGNDVTMHGSLFGAISLYDQASDNLVRGNRISGSGAYALQVGTFVPPGTARGNAFIGNNISAFRADVADIFLDVNSQGTMVKGDHGVVVDLGAGDSISGSGTSALGDALGARVRAAQAVKREIMQAVPGEDP